MHVEPVKEHRWLQKLVGEWSFAGEASMGPDKPPEKFTGTESVRAIGEIWTVAEGQGEMPGGGPSTTMMSLGYDPQQQRFVGTWLGSMMAHLWIYHGSLDAAGNVLTLEAEGPSIGGREAGEIPRCD